MYSEQDYREISAQLRKRWIVLLVPCALLLAAVIACFILRSRLLTTALTMLLGFGFIFCYGLFISPVAAYRRHLDDVLFGRVRQITGAFKEMEETAVLREGVQYYPMLINVGNMQEPEDDRLFYYDANLPRPEWQVGDRLVITAHDKAVGAWQYEKDAPQAG